jgi:hypothetical protein
LGQLWWLLLVIGAFAGYSGFVGWTPLLIPLLGALYAGTIALINPQSIDDVPGHRVGNALLQWLLQSAQMGAVYLVGLLVAYLF